MEKNVKEPKPTGRQLRNKPKKSPSKLATAKVDTDIITKYQAKTPLGQKLAEIRARAIASGMKLLTEEELDCEIAERRGGIG